MEWVYSTSAVASFFQVSARTLQYWHRAGCPREARGKWNLQQVHLWWTSHIMASETAVEASDESLQEARRRYWTAKGQREELRLDTERGGLIPLAEVVDGWCARASEMVALLESLKDRLPSLLEGRNRAEMREIIQQEVYSLRKAYVRAGTHTPPPSDQAVAEYLERKSA